MGRAAVGGIDYRGYPQPYYSSYRPAHGYDMYDQYHYDSYRPRYEEYYRSSIY